MMALAAADGADDRVGGLELVGAELQADDAAGIGVEVGQCEEEAGVGLLLEGRVDGGVGLLEGVDDGGDEGARRRRPGWRCHGARQSLLGRGDVYV